MLPNGSDCKTRRSGFFAVIGAPNAGKSTLVNALVGAKVSIVSPKVQTTRTRVTGILTQEQDQIVFIDTPGIFEKTKGGLETSMVDRAWVEAGQSERLLFVLDAKRGLSKEGLYITQRLKAEERRAVLILNKIDLLAPNQLLPLTKALNEMGLFDEIFMVSAVNKDGLDALTAYLRATLPYADWLYDEEEITDLPSRMLASEITREKLFLRLNQELPYQLTVECEDWQLRRDGSLKVHQVIYVARQGHKAIILGKGGQNLKAIGAAARLELSQIFDRKVHLFLFVKVRPKWMNDPERYRAMGLTLS